MAMYVTDLRKKLRRSSAKQDSKVYNLIDRRKGDRRVLTTEFKKNNAGEVRVWLTPGERALIEDLYLLEDKQ